VQYIRIIQYRLYIIYIKQEIDNKIQKRTAAENRGVQQRRTDKDNSPEDNEREDNIKADGKLTKRLGTVLGEATRLGGREASRSFNKFLKF
jgi:hypothetical protein